MKKQLLTLFLVAIAITSFATIIIVDINGAGQFSSIQTAINNALAGDTIQVWPGVYNESVNLNKNVVLQGSGYENTIITWMGNPAVTVSAGKIKWFNISCNGGTGVIMSNGKITNCIVKSCTTYGIYSNSGNPYIVNCIVFNNGSYGIYAQSSTTLIAINTISRNNTQAGFYSGGSGVIWRSYCNGSMAEEYATSGCVCGNQGCIDSDPIFVSTTNYHLSATSPCLNKGQPSLFDPDGTVSDMGYFGGPDCPIFPVVYEMTTSPNGANIDVQAKARANY